MASSCNHFESFLLCNTLHYPLKLTSWVIVTYVPGGQTFAMIIVI